MKGASIGVNIRNTPAGTPRRVLDYQPVHNASMPVEQ